MQTDSQGTNKEEQQTPKSTLPLSVVVRKKCSISPNCGYLEIRSTHRFHCKRTTCNYFWSLSGADSFERKKTLAVNESCCPDVEQAKNSIAEEAYDDIIDRQSPETEISFISYSPTNGSSNFISTQTVAQKSRSNAEEPESSQNFSEFYEKFNGKSRPTKEPETDSDIKDLPSPSDENDSKSLVATPCEEKSKPNRAACVPTTCETLNGSKRAKSCCDNPVCPINDMNSSAYKFLLKVKMCCKKKGCQLAARICDIYEPLVKVDMENLVGNGEEKYHFLGKDDYTIYDLMQPSAIQTNRLWIEPKKKEEPGPNFIRDYKKPEPAENEMFRESIYVEPDKREKRTSVVSWHMPNHDDTEMSEKSQTNSDEQLIAKATAEANKFRQAQQISKTGAVFGDIIREQEKNKDTIFDKPEGMLNFEPDSKDLLFKSQLDNINLNPSEHKTKCCASLVNKLKRKKKDKKLSNVQPWASNGDNERRKPNIEDAIEETEIVIGKILNKI